MTAPYPGALVLVNVDAAHNGGSPHAPAVVTAVRPDGRVNVRVTYDGPPSDQYPGARHRPEYLTGVEFHDTADPAAANRHGQYGAFWPPGLMLAAAILQNQETIMSELSQQQSDVNAAAATLTSAATTISTVASDLGNVLSSINAELASLNAQIAALGTPVDTSALDTAVAGLAAPLAALQAADAALDAIETPAATTTPAPAAPVASGDSGSAA